MKKNRIYGLMEKIGLFKMIKIMRFTIFILFLSLSQTFAVNTYSQQAKLSLDMRNARLEDVLDRIEKNSEFFFMYNKNMINVDLKVDIQVEDKNVNEVLNKIFANTDISYSIKDRQILLINSRMDGTGNESITQQQKSISGKVTDSSGASLPGVSVVVKGTTTGVITDMDGKYTLAKVPENETLIFSFVGMKTQEVKVYGKSSVNVTMVEEAIGLEEVVAVGYGTVKKVNLTGSVDAVNGQRLSERPVSNVSKALQGISPGTIVTDNGGAPGTDGATIRIRGVGTFGNKNPLILVDGVTVGNMNDIDAKDIDNISILKDAASAAIYGSRAANGVILITTKRGTSGVVKVSYSNYFGNQSITRAPEHVSADQYMMLVNESCINANKQPKYSQEAIEKTMDGSEPYKYPNTDWWGLLFRNAIQQKHSISISGGSEKLKTSVSLNYLDNQGVLINTNSDHFGIRLNNDLKLGKNINCGLDISFSKRYRSAPSRLSEIYWNLLHDVPPTIVAKYPDGTYQLGPTNRNPLAAAEKSGFEWYRNYQAIITSFFSYEIVKGLNFTGKYSIKEDFEEGKRYYNNYEFKDYQTKATLLTWRSSLTQWSPHNHYSNLQGLLNYDKKNEKHNLHILAGYSREYNYWKDLGGTRTDFYSNYLQELNLGSSTGQTNYGNSNEWALLSYFGRINYSFEDKYLFEGNFRNDGSSRFAEGKRWGFFPSFSLGWRISEENLLKTVEWISNLKLRLSWGQLGNQDIGLYNYIQTVSLGQTYSFSNQLVDGAARTSLANLDISWEKTTSSNIGIDIGLWDNKLTATADYFIRNTDDILLARDIPLTVGLGAPTQNVGAIKNTGWELSINYQEKIRDVSLKVGFNISDVKNEITKYGQASVSGWNITKQGESMESLYGYKTEGLFQNVEDVASHAFQQTITGTGDIKYKDMNNDGIINDQDKIILGSTIPRYSYGLNLQVNYRNFDLGLFLNGVGKCNGYQMGALIEGPIWDGFTTKEMLDRWTPENKDAKWPRLVYGTTHNQEPSDRWIQNTAFMRLKNFQIGYTIPKYLINKIKIENARIYLDGENVFTITKANNLDPEFPSGRANYYPQTKIYSVGVDITF